MAIDWCEVRQLMLTSSDGAVSPVYRHSTHNLDILLKPEQVSIVERCLRFTYQGLQWAMQYDVSSQFQHRRWLDHHFCPRLNHFFLIEDDDIIGIFKDCHGPWSGTVGVASCYPKTLQEYVELQAQGKSLIVSEVVLEKETLRLANRRTLNQQPKFIRELVYPALMGVVAHHSECYKPVKAAQKTSPQCINPTHNATGMNSIHYSTGASDNHSSHLKPSLNREFLTHIFLNTEQSNQFWLKHSPLSLFYDPASPFNVEHPETQLWREAPSLSEDGLRTELMCDAV